MANHSELNKQDMDLLKNTKSIMDTSGRRIDTLTALINTLGGDAFCFGSHAPVLDHCTGLLRIESLTVVDASKAVRDKLRLVNILRLLGIW